MPPSELDVRAFLFGPLSTRRDIDNLTLELIGKYNVDRLTGSQIPDDIDRLDFGLACQLEFIFDLQRTHLQSRTPFNGLGSSGLTERLPYLLSFQTAKGAFELLNQLSKDFIGRFGGGQDFEISSKINVFVRALISGTRMLCLHPCVRPGEIINPAPAFHPHSWEQVLTWVCGSALSRVPRRHQGLQLPRMGRKMFPMDDSRLMNVVNECTTDFFHDSHYKYWTLYDISCSVVAAYTQHRSTADDAASEDALSDEFPSEDMTSMDNANEAGRLLGLLAAKIADSVIAEARRVRMSRGGDQCVVLLMDIVEVLNPVLAIHSGQSHQAGYEELLVLKASTVVSPTLPDVTDTRNRLCRDAHKILALEEFQKLLKQRELVLRDTNEELPALLSRIERVCLDIASAHNRHYFQGESQHAESYKHIGPASPLALSEDGGRSIATLRLYAANCKSVHMIAEGPSMSAMRREADEQHSSSENGSLYFPEGTVCPFCPDDAENFYCLREISPLSQILDVINQKCFDLDNLRRHRQRSFMQGAPPGVTRGPLTAIRTDPDVIARQQYPASPTSPGNISTLSLDPHIPDYATSALPELTTAEEGPVSPVIKSSRWGVLKRMGVKKNPTEAPSDPPTRNPLHYSLRGGEVNVSLSTDSRHLILWTNKVLGLYFSEKCDMQQLAIMPSPMKNPDMILVSKSYYVIVQKGRNNDEVGLGMSNTIRKRITLTTSV
ncbi:hypothetical protein GP486_001164 [Trichoglossum hirsutum]|uniref:Uncharacterized protein n=1 Tax=Trichoglossum hirsutum TaxID=265104 RepID=A0A9P8LH75_9PEZI|nr:hypothetical protein GP486_001164 [Trichoglossum hirsutum]